MKNPNLSKLVVLFSCAVSLSQQVKAECVVSEPLCQSMHAMSNDLDCIQKKIPAMLCRAVAKDDAEDLKVSAEAARKALLAKPEFNDSQKADINQLFDQLVQAIDQLIANIDGDAQLKEASLQNIIAVRKNGHLEFQN